MLSSRPLAPLLLAVSLSACSSGKGEGQTDIQSAEDVVQACLEGEPNTLTLVVEFPALADGCPFGERDNLEREDAHVTARIEQSDALSLPADAVICDVVFDFEGVSGGQGTPMVYDDNFFFTFNDVVLAASHAPMVQQLEAEDGLFYAYDWADLAGTPFSFDTDIPTFCIGEDAGLSTCDIPPPETDGVMALSFDGDITSELSYRAVDEQRTDFSFVTIGDNDDSDCSHEAFSFAVEVPYIKL